MTITAQLEHRRVVNRPDVENLVDVQPSGHKLTLVIILHKFCVRQTEYQKSITDSSYSESSGCNIIIPNWNQ